MKKTIITMLPLILTGCAGVMSDGEDKLTIATTTTDASIYLDGRYLGDGRVSTHVKRGDNYEIRIQKDGCATIHETTGDKLDGWFWANILIDWGIVSMPVDLISGNAWELDKSEYLLIPECKS